jgi:hypothetical protein
MGNELVRILNPNVSVLIERIRVAVTVFVAVFAAHHSTSFVSASIPSVFLVAKSNRPRIVRLAASNPVTVHSSHAKRTVSYICGISMPRIRMSGIVGHLQFSPAHRAKVDFILSQNPSKMGNELVRILNPNVSVLIERIRVAVKVFVAVFTRLH